MRAKLFSLAFTVTLVLLLMAVVGLALFALDQESSQWPAQTPKQKGMSYASWWHGQYSHPDADLALENLAATGADWLSLIVTQYQDNISSTAIYADSEKTPTDADLAHVIAYAHNLGLKVMLKPHLDLADDPGHWRGQIGQSFTESEWDTWFSSYQDFIVHYAQLAQTHSVDQLCVGTELSASQGHTAHWRAVIAALSSQYSGPLTYAANWDNADLAWWDAVDYIGIDAYYPLTDKCDPTVEELKVAWQPHVTELANLAESRDRSIVFTEIGYRSQDCANQHPWQYDTTGTVDLQEQSNAYSAAFESVFNRDWLAGIYWWVWETDPFQGGPCDQGYTPYDKPAEDVLRSWYGAPPRVLVSDPVPDDRHALSIYTDALGPGWENWSYNATVDLFSTGSVYSGRYAISVAAQPWGALSLQHASFSTTPYYWLEFYVRKSSAEQDIRVVLNTDQDQELRYRPVGDCRYTGGEVIEPGVWTRVRIPLSHLDATGRLVQRVSIKNYQGQPSSFWVDQVCLLVNPWYVYLPLITRSDGAEPMYHILQ